MRTHREGEHREIHQLRECHICQTTGTNAGCEPPYWYQDYSFFLKSLCVVLSYYIISVKKLGLQQGHTLDLKSHVESHSKFKGPYFHTIFPTLGYCVSLISNPSLPLCCWISTGVPDSHRKISQERRITKLLPMDSFCELLSLLEISMFMWYTEICF